MLHHCGAIQYRPRSRRVQSGQKETMSDLKDKAKNKINDAADVAKKAADKVADKTKDLAHSAGKKLEEGAKKLNHV
jgi:hypothetical protein